MISEEEIDRAISAHGMWKVRLKRAIDTGTLDTPLTTIRADDQCVFGKWLSGPDLDATEKLTAHYRKIRALHTEFHSVAARVAELAQAGNKAEADRIVALGGEYHSASSHLTQAMMEWKEGLR